MNQQAKFGKMRLNYKPCHRWRWLPATLLRSHTALLSTPTDYNSLKDCVWHKQTIIEEICSQTLSHCCKKDGPLFLWQDALLLQMLSKVIIIHTAQNLYICEGIVQLHQHTEATSVVYKWCSNHLSTSNSPLGVKSLSAFCIIFLSTFVVMENYVAILNVLNEFVINVRNKKLIS